MVLFSKEHYKNFKIVNQNFTASLADFRPLHLASKNCFKHLPEKKSSNKNSPKLQNDKLKIYGSL
jgi:hypothetical protein